MQSGTHLKYGDGRNPGEEEERKSSSGGIQDAHANIMTLHLSHSSQVSQLL